MFDFHPKNEGKGACCNWESRDRKQEVTVLRRARREAYSNGTSTETDTKTQVHRLYLYTCGTISLGKVGQLYSSSVGGRGGNGGPVQKRGRNPSQACSHKQPLGSPAKTGPTCTRTEYNYNEGKVRYIM
jgi:hypothetical protein